MSRVNTTQIDTSFIKLLAPSYSQKKAVIEAFQAEIIKQAERIAVKPVVHQKSIDESNHANEVLELVCDELELNIYLFQSGSRKRELSEARQIYSYILRKVSTVDVSLSLAGQLINRDHSTIHTQARIAESLSKVNKPYAEKLNKCVLAFQEKFLFREFNNIPQY